MNGTEGCSTPMGDAGRVRPRRLAEEAQLLSSRPVESEQPAVEFNDSHV